jgi:hypothetical protein
MQDLKAALAAMLTAPEFWHDSLRPYPSTDGLHPDDLLLFVEWSQGHKDRGGAAPDWVLTEPVPGDDEVGPGGLSLLALSVFLEGQAVCVEPSLDLMYCRRPGS